MARTIAIQGSDEVMATLAEPGTFYKGRWQKVNITGVDNSEDISLDVRESLVGLTIPTIFSKEQLESQGVNLRIPANSRLAYVPDVIDTLNVAGKYIEAEQLGSSWSDLLDMYVFEEGIYRLA